MGGFVKGVANVLPGINSKQSGGPGTHGFGRFKGDKQPIKEEVFKQQVGDNEKQEQLRQRQEIQRKRLEDTASGKRPSLAEAQMKASSNRSLAQQVGAAQSRKGGSSASRERSLARSSGEGRREVMESAGVARLQEQKQAEAALAQELANTRATELGIAESDRATLQRLEELKVQENIAVQGLNQAGFASSANQRGGVFKSVLSDENKKTKIKKESFMDKLADNKNKVDKIKNMGRKKKSDDGGSTGKRISQQALSRISSEDQKTNVRVDLEKREEEGVPDSVGKKTPEKETKKEDKAKGGIADKVGTAIKDHVKGKLEEKIGPLKTFKQEKKEVDVNKLVKAADQTGQHQTKQVSAQKILENFSDSKLKKNVNPHPENFSPKDFLDALQAYSYEYKDGVKDDPRAGHGRHLSVMAQDLQKAGPVGRSMVEETDDGLQVNYGKGFGAILAAQAHLNERLSNLEKKKKS